MTARLIRAICLGDVIYTWRGAKQGNEPRHRFELIHGDALFEDQEAILINRGSYRVIPK